MSNSIMTSRNDVEIFLKTIQDKLKYDCRNLQISIKQGNNKKFLMEFALTKEDIRQIILSLKVTDFSAKMESIHPKFKNHLYLFAPYCNFIHKAGIRVRVQIYLKLVYTKPGNQIIVVSVHLPKEKLSYCYN